MKFKESLLEKYGQKALMMADRTVFVDRPIKALETVLTYIQTDQQYLPDDLTSNQIKLVEAELKH